MPKIQQAHAANEEFHFIGDSLEDKLHLLHQTAPTFRSIKTKTLRVAFHPELCDSCSEVFSMYGVTYFT
jgi:hypothetical protein